MDHLIDSSHADKVELAPECPRCGYELKGDIATWQESCPLRGQCPECGYEFAWLHILRPQRADPEWLFEYSRGMLATIWAVPATLIHLIRPGRFFEQVRLWHEPRRRRLWWWLPLVLVMSYILYMAIPTMCMLVIMYGLQGSSRIRTSLYSWEWVGDADWVHFERLFISPFGDYTSEWAGGPASASGAIAMKWVWHFYAPTPGLMFFLGASIAWPLTLYLLKPTRYQVKIRNCHVLRASIYSMGWVGMFLGILTLGNSIRWLLSLSQVSFGFGMQWMDQAIYSERWIALFAPNPVLEGIGLPWSIEGICLGPILIAWHWWWWYMVIARHWKLNQPLLTWFLLWIIAMCVAALAALGPMTYRYLFMNV